MRGFKAWVRLLMPPVLWNFLKYLQRGGSPYYGRENLDKMLEEYLNYDGGYYVELGANDGVSQSNTVYFERRRNWRGVLVEPAPNQYLACRENRSASNHIFCNACVPFDYAEKFVEIAYAGLMSTPMGLETDVADPLTHAHAGVPFLKPTENLFLFGAIARPLNDLLVEASAPRRMDLLSLDVEGAELAVLKGIDHQQFRFNYLCIETRSADALSAYLAQHGYRFVKQLTHLDYLFENALATD